MNRLDAVVIGGGPAGSTIATYLARQGLSVTLFEKRTFPRFHIGESLLPASLPILDDLGVRDKIERTSVRKPGGKWYYGHRPVFSDFGNGPSTTSFAKTPYAYMVKRGEFDNVLLENAAATGADIRQQYSVTDLLQSGERVTGVVARDPNGVVEEYQSDIVFDCSGFGAVIPTKFQLRKENRLKRMAVFGHYRCEPLNEDLKNGWFVGQMLYDGWIWMIPLESNLISVGIVIPLEEFRTANQSPQEFLETWMHRMPIVKAGLSETRQLEGKVHIYGNLGYTTSRAWGNGWVLVGDAAFFIDPCYSSGVHLALSMAREASAIYLDHRQKGSSLDFAPYEKKLRRDETLMLRFVDSFYMASRNRVLKWVVPASLTDAMNRQFVSVTGGEFAEHPFMVNWVYSSSKLISSVFPFRAAV